MKKVVTLIAFVLCSFQSLKITAQSDTVFWFAAPWVTPDSWWRDNLGFHISTYSNTTTVRIQQPASVFDTTVLIPPFTSFDKYFNYMIDSCENKPANKVLCHGFKVSSDFPINVIYDELSRPPGFFNTEAYSLKGKAALGQNFILPFHTTYSIQTLGGDLNGDAVTTQCYSQFNIVTSADNTTIWITPKCAIVGHSAGVTYSVFLPGRGTTYTGQDVSQAVAIPSNNISGTTVTADKPIAITLTDDSMKPGGGGCYDIVGDQIVPVENLGSEYIAHKGLMYAGANESIFIVGTQNSTAVTIDDGSTTVFPLNAGATKSYTLTQPLTHIQASSSVYVWHISGMGCETGAELLSPLTCFGQNQYIFSRKLNQPFFMNLYCQAGAQSTFTLNGSTSSVTASAFTVVPGTSGNWLGAQISFSNIAVNSSNLISNSAGNFGISLLNGDITTGVTYYGMNSFPLTTSVTAGSSQSICANTNTISLTGSITGGSSSGIWSTTGTGAFSSASNLNTTYSLSLADMFLPQLTFVLSTGGSCISVTDTSIVTLYPLPLVNLSTAANSTVCVGSGAITLNGFPAGGIYSGTSVSGNIFTPSSAGNFSPNYTFTDSNGCTNNDTLGIFVSLCTGIENQTANSSAVKVFPNPFKNSIQFSNPTGKNVKVTVYDITGKIIISDIVFDHNYYSLNTEKINSGLYYLKIESEEKQQYIKLVKVN